MNDGFLFFCSLFLAALPLLLSLLETDYVQGIIDSQEMHNLKTVTSYTQKSISASLRITIIIIGLIAAICTFIATNNAKANLAEQVEFLKKTNNTALYYLDRVPQLVYSKTIRPDNVSTEDEMTSNKTYLGCNTLKGGDILKFYDPKECWFVLLPINDELKYDIQYHIMQDFAKQTSDTKLIDNKTIDKSKITSILVDLAAGNTYFTEKCNAADNHKDCIKQLLLNKEITATQIRPSDSGVFEIAASASPHHAKWALISADQLPASVRIYSSPRSRSWDSSHEEEMFFDHNLPWEKDTKVIVVADRTKLRRQPYFGHGSTEGILCKGTTLTLMSSVEYDSSVDRYEPVFAHVKIEEQKSSDTCKSTLASGEEGWVARRFLQTTDQ
ncbi:hypothetical protein [Desulfovibrio sp. TomC]|uniref:hypothetical protein n=1 Tax=Desulfovibrio sp. TomC TaxID=1562888 RepID=UPI000573F786|nr:hypothetical protein [Desulfovibrio sp. TomC]KHK00555.1 hypothetical protein NY78_4023 [Desulfovibrio sp. TomC]